MRCRDLLAVLVILAIAAATGCTDVRQFNKEEVVKVFTSSEPAMGLEAAAPTNIPVLAIQEMNDWNELCGQCHRGPYYSSNTILIWGHRDSCVADATCRTCHHEQLHETDMRGDKSNCYECHLNRDLHYTCDNCHGEGCWDESIVRHDDVFIDSHGENQQWQEMDCTVCHGSDRWCFDCHGIEMPHPEDVLDTHPSWVQGHPETCNKCHGEEACDNCHRERGIVPDLEEFLRAQLGLDYGGGGE